MEDKKSKNIIAYISIQTSDNENFVVDITESGWLNVDIDSILTFAYSCIQKRKKRFGFFVKTKRFTTIGEKYECHFSKSGFDCVQNQIVLTNSSARVLKDRIKTGKFTVLSDFCPARAVSTKALLK